MVMVLIFCGQVREWYMFFSNYSIGEQLCSKTGDIFSHPLYLGMMTLLVAFSLIYGNWLLHHKRRYGIHILALPVYLCVTVLLMLGLWWLIWVKSGLRFFFVSY